MKFLNKTAIFLALLTLAACAGGGVTPPVGSNGLAGTYTGEILVGNSSPFVSEKVSFTVDASGKVGGTTLGTDQSGKPGGTGTLSGTLTPGSLSSFIVYDLTFSSTDLGTYKTKGSNGMNSSATKQIAITGDGEKTGAPTFSGQFVLTATKQ